MRTAAIFDLDGTLVVGTSAERLFVPYLFRKRVIGFRQAIAMVAKAATLPFVGRTRALRRNKRYLAGLEVDTVRRHATDFVDQVLLPRIGSERLDRLESARASGKLVLLLTGAPGFIADAIRERLGMNDAIGTDLEVVNGRYTGRIEGPHLFGPAKVDGVRDFATKHGLDLEASSGYADHHTDVAFLECFGEAVAVDPDPGLRREATRRGWEVMGAVI